MAQKPLNKLSRPLQDLVKEVQDKLNWTPSTLNLRRCPKCNKNSLLFISKKDKDGKKWTSIMCPAGCRGEKTLVK